MQEAIVVIRDIFRKYPNKYENIISILCENLDSLDEPEARYVGALAVVEGVDVCRHSMWILPSCQSLHDMDHRRICRKN